MHEFELVWLRDPEGKSCQLTVLLLTDCPVNLLGRDGIIAPGLFLITMPLLAVKRESERHQGDIFVVQGTFSPHYYFYYILNIPPASSGTALMAEGMAILQEQDKMHEDDLHVTLWFKKTFGPDTDYEVKLKRLTPTVFTVNYVYSNATSRSVGGVTLQPQIRVV